MHIYYFEKLEVWQNARLFLKKSSQLNALHKALTK